MIDDLAGVTVEIGFGVTAGGGAFFQLNHPTKGVLDNATYLLGPDTVFVDVSTSVASVATNRGRERELDEYTTGKATVVFNDDDRTFDPAYSGSPYAGQIIPMRRIRIAWHNTDMFNGWVDDWTVDYEPGDNLSRVTASCVDGFAILAIQDLNVIAPAFTGDTSGARVNRVLDRFEVDYPASRAVDTGLSTLGDTTYGENALSYLQTVTKSEAGYLFISADGTLTFRERTAILNIPAGVVFSDDRTAGVPYRRITQRSAADLLYTRVTGTSETTSNQMEAVADSAITDDFLTRTLALGTLFTLDDTQTQNLVDSQLERFSTVEVRFQTAQLNLTALTTSEIQSVVALDLTDVVSVERSPLNVGATIDRLSFIDGVSHRISEGSWTVDLSFSNADTRSFLTLDDPVFGALDSFRLAF